ncbi:MAG: SGNH/GDSL hydrolase family protein [Pyrinomonadaceae bacterium]
MNRKLIVLFFVVFSFSTLVFAQDKPYDRQKTWDAEINSLLEIDTKQRPPKNAVMFVGSSSLRMWKTLPADFPKLEFINRAFGGSEFEDLIYYAPRIVFPYRPRKIFVYEGDNDINSGKSAERVLEDFRIFANMVKEKLPNTKLYFISIKPSIARIKLWGEMEKANRLIADEIKTMKNAQYVDVASKMLDENGKPFPDIFITDNLHMNAKGYAIWRDVFKKYVK